MASLGDAISGIIVQIYSLSISFLAQAILTFIYNTSSCNLSLCSYRYHYLLDLIKISHVIYQMCYVVSIRKAALFGLDKGGINVGL